MVGGEGVPRQQQARLASKRHRRMDGGGACGREGVGARPREGETTVKVACRASQHT